MLNNYAEIAFTDSVRAAQEAQGTRRQNERLENSPRGNELGPHEMEFIRQRDGFYLATVSESGYPYIQFRGGAPGFLKVLDTHTLGFADFSGNRQYISLGNLSRNDKAALFLMDYAAQRRLKIFARVERKDAAAAPELIERLAVPGYAAQIERALLFHVEAFDWNCPQHITPRFTVAEVGTLNQPLYEHLEKLEAENRRLQALIDVVQNRER